MFEIIQIYLQNIVFYHFRAKKSKEILVTFFKWIQLAGFLHVYTRCQFTEMVIDWRKRFFFTEKSSCESYLGLSLRFCPTIRELSSVINRF